MFCVVIFGRFLPCKDKNDQREAISPCNFSLVAKLIDLIPTKIKDPSLNVVFAFHKGAYVTGKQLTSEYRLLNEGNQGHSNSSRY